MNYGGIEAGGTKWVCCTSAGGGVVSALGTFPTTTPDETLDRAVQFFRAQGQLDALGVGSFGPVDLKPGSPTWGHVTSTPKPGWKDTDVVSTLKDAFDVPVAFDTDVNAAALAEHRWGAASGLDTFCYITVGTGIGGGAMVNGQLLHGLVHLELGHMRIPHDRVLDPFEGACSYHGDCLEGLASGQALYQRWGKRPEELSDPTVWDLEAEYLALGLVNVTWALSPQRVVLGGGVPKQPGLLPLVRRRLVDLVGGYIGAPELRSGGVDSYLVPPGCGDQAGVLGAVELARRATEPKQA